MKLSCRSVVAAVGLYCLGLCRCYDSLVGVTIFKCRCRCADDNINVSNAIAFFLDFTIPLLFLFLFDDT